MVFFRLTSIHEAEHPASAATAAQAIFIGGGNTFQLLNNLYQHKLIDVIRKFGNHIVIRDPRTRL